MRNQKLILKKKDMSNSQDLTPKTDKQGVKTRELILINDSFNTFDHVINCLEAICDHEPIQAEQCALITHYKGSCVISSGSMEELEFYRQDLILYGLDVQLV